MNESIQPIGKIEELNGSVTVTHADGTTDLLAGGDSVFQGDAISTGVDGNVSVVFADETIFSMAADGDIVLDEMVYDPVTQEGSINFNIVDGVFTFVSGQIAKTDPDAMTIDTPVATIGIRGTQLGIEVGGDEAPLNIILMEEKGGFVGEVVVQNESGVEVLNTAFSGITVDSAMSAPVIMGEVSKSEVFDIFGSSLDILPNKGAANSYDNERSVIKSEEATIESFTDEELSQEILADNEEPSAEELANMETAAGESLDTELINVEEVSTEEVSTEETGVNTDAAEQTQAEALIQAEARIQAEIRAANDAARASGEASIKVAAIAADKATVYSNNITQNNTQVAAEQAARDSAQATAEQAARDSAKAAAKSAAEQAAKAAKATEQTRQDTADTPKLNVADSSGTEDTPIALDINAALTDTVGNEVLTIEISGVPEGAILSAGVFDSNVWNVNPSDLSGLTITPPQNFNGAMQLEIKAISNVASSGQNAIVSGTINVNVVDDGTDVVSVTTVDVITSSDALLTPVNTTTVDLNTEVINGNITKVFTNSTITTITETLTTTTITPTTTTIYENGAFDVTTSAQTVTSKITDVQTDIVTQNPILFSTSTLDNIITSNDTVLMPVITTVAEPNTTVVNSNITKVFINATTTTVTSTETTTTITPTTTTIFADGSTTQVIKATPSITIEITNVQTDIVTQKPILFSTAVFENVVVTEASVADPILSSVFVDETLNSVDHTNDPKAGTELAHINTIRHYTDTSSVTTTNTITTTPTTTITYADGTIKIITGDLMVDVIADTVDTVTTRDTQLSEAITESVIEIVNVVAEPVVDTVKTNVVNENGNVSTLTYHFVDTTTTTTTTTTTVTPTTTIINVDGSVSITKNTSSVTSTVADEIKVSVRDELVSTSTLENVVSSVDNVLPSITTTSADSNTEVINGNVTKVFTNSTDTITTTTETIITTVPITTTVYVDGSPNTVVEGTATVVTNITDIQTNIIPQDPILFSTATLDNIVTTKTIVSDPIITSKKTKDVEEVDGDVTTTYNSYIDSTSVDTSVISTVVPTTTTVYVDARPNLIIEGTLATSTDITTIVTDTPRLELFSTATFENIMTTETTLSTPLVTVVYEDIITEVKDSDGDVYKVVVRHYTETTTVDSTVTEITTPTITIVYADGSPNNVTYGNITSVPTTTTNSQISNTWTEEISREELDNMNHIDVVIDNNNDDDVDVIGSNDDDAINVTGNNINGELGVRSGSGDDEISISGRNFDDVSIRSGSGDDEISIDSDALAAANTIDGGTGYDTVVLQDDGSYDLSTLRNIFEDIEELNLDGNAELTIDAIDVDKITDGNDTLKITGEVGDVVHLKGNWDQGESQDGYTVYSSGDATVSISDEVTLS